MGAGCAFSLPAPSLPTSPPISFIIMSCIILRLGLGLGLGIGIGLGIGLG